MESGGLVYQSFIEGHDWGQACDFAILQQYSARSARQHKASGAQAPGSRSVRTERTRGAGDSLLECAGIVPTCRDDDGALDHGSIQSGVALRLPPHWW
jgi:hypothetical protein